MARTAGADLAGRAHRAAVAAVVRVALDIDAAAVAERLPARARGTADAVHAHAAATVRPRRTDDTAGPAVIRIDISVSTRSVAEQ